MADRTRSDETGSTGGEEIAVPSVGGFDVPQDLAEAADYFFGARLPLARAYARMLSTDAVVRGLIGPREVPRLWDRHLLNCAAVAELIPMNASVVDVGTGAGLPGVVLALARPDLVVTLIEPLERRIGFLFESVASLGLDHTTVVRARAEDCVGRLSPADVVTARAVAPLDRLARWCLPLAERGGRLLALKGASAVEEIETHREAVAKLGGGVPVIRKCGGGYIAPPATVVVIVRERVVGPPAPQGKGARSSPARRSGRGRTRPENGSAYGDTRRT